MHPGRACAPVCQAPSVRGVRRRPSLRGAARWRLVTVASVALGWLATGAALANPALEAGRQIFTGAQPLVAHMPGHAQRLPVAASRCINCHAAPGLRAAGGATAGLGAASRAGANTGTGSFGPRLDAAHLLQPQARRGGPPSRYDAAGLCRVLREGVDPAGVVLVNAMPRYQIDDSACRQLWTLLTSDL